jgi:hypothetical protein
VGTVDGGADSTALRIQARGGDPGPGVMFNRLHGLAVGPDVRRRTRRWARGCALRLCTYIVDETVNSEQPQEIPQPIVIVRSGTDLVAAVDPGMHTRSHASAASRRAPGYGTEVAHGNDVSGPMRSLARNSCGLTAR